MSKLSDGKSKEWDESYKNKNNFLFYPEYEVIKFVAKYIKRREGIESYRVIRSGCNKCLDLGCGIGRHVFFLDDYGFEAYGIDLSAEAIHFAKENCCYQNREDLVNHFTVGSITDMPYADSTFDFIISHGVLDSMNFSIAEQAIEESSRVLKKDGLFYLNLIAPNGMEYPTEFASEVEVKDAHEQGTIQSYFNWSKILKLIGDKFTISDAQKVTTESVVKIYKSSRWHLIVQKI